jgi:uncharacterized protein YabE (DUF348 family)
MRTLGDSLRQKYVIGLDDTAPEVDTKLFGGDEIPLASAQEVYLRSTHVQRTIESLQVRVDVRCTQYI